MKDMYFKIMVGDILRDSSIKDIVHFKEKFSSLFPQLIKPGIEAKIIVQGMDSSSLLLIFEYMQANIACDCDKCGSNFIHPIYIKQKQVKCFFDAEIKTKEDEDILWYNIGDTTIDIEEYMVQSLQLEDSYIHVCTVCQKNDNNEK